MVARVEGLTVSSADTVDRQDGCQAHCLNVSATMAAESRALRPPSPTLPQPVSALRMLNLVYVNDVSDEAIMTFSLAFPECTVANYYGDEVKAGVTSENPGTDCGGWDADGGGLDAETVLFGAADGFD